MYRVLIADDEDIIRNGIKKMLQRKRPQLSIVAECKNGEEILDFIKFNRVDIVVTDICMPYKSGLDIAQYVFEEKLNIQIVIISGYEEFEYAKRAMDYNVKCFLTKPVNTAEILSNLDICVESIDKTRSEAEKNAKSYVNDFEYLRSKLFSALSRQCSYNSFYDYTVNRTDNFNLFKFPLVCEVLFQDKETSFSDTEIERIKPLCENTLDTYVSFFFNNSANYFKCIVCCMTEKDANVFADEVIHAVGLFYTKGIKYSIGNFGGVKQFIANKIAPDDAGDYIDALLEKQNQKAEKIAYEISQINDDEYHNLYCRAFSKKIGSYCGTEINPTLSGDEMLSACIEAIEHSMGLVYAVEKFVKDNVLNNVTAASVADHFKLSSGYIGKLYKNKTGRKLIDYILEAKMEKAKELLINGRYKAEEIAALLGYSQSLNFRTQFKRFTGYTPSEFIKRD